MNYAIIIVNIAIFLLTYHPVRTIMGVQLLRDFAVSWKLNPAMPQLSQFITYAFLHAGLGHIFGNMFFLFIFGNNVNDKLGNIGYLCFYLAGAAFAGWGHCLLHTTAIPILGASGAVAAVTGAYLVLYPKTLITVVYWFFFIGTIEVPALYFIGFKMIFWDNIFERSTHNVAYDAHLAGYLFGILSILLMLAMGILQRSNFDMWSLLKRWNRRKQYTAAVGHDMNNSSGVKKIHSVQRELTPQQQAQLDKVNQLRQEISSLIAGANLAEAAEKYIQLLEVDPEQVLPRTNQLDVANQLMSMSYWLQCADAYEKFLKHYSSYPYIEQVELMLGIVYSRYLEKKQLAVKYLQKAMDKLTDPSQKQLCQQELARLQG